MNVQLTKFGDYWLLFNQTRPDAIIKYFKCYLKQAKIQDVRMKSFPFSLAKQPEVLYEVMCV